jgi:hypothetical protein
MVKYICDRCGIIFSRKSSYDAHINRKNICEIQTNDNLTCLNNNKQDSLTLNLILKELQNVKKELYDVKKENKNVKNELKTMNEMTNTKIQKLEEYNERLIKHTDMNNRRSINKGIVNNKTINNESINNGTINTTINIVAFGKETMDFNIDDIGKLCQGNKTVPNLINYMHFNESKPENHNVYMPNRKNKSEVFVHNGVKWMLADKKVTVEKLIDKGIEYVEGKMEELSNVISQSKYNAVERAINAYNENEEDSNNEANKKITKDIELILYNNKDLVMAPKIK